jgi:cyclopropane fatty-acyl-phospholipid synthase-like methyltransferase
MSVRIDPEKTEISTLLELVGDFAGKRVLEIGSGDGRLTWRYADQAAHVTALEPDPSRVDKAKQETPASLQDRVTFLPMDIQTFEVFKGSPGFDVAIMSWSL